MTRQELKDIATRIHYVLKPYLWDLSDPKTWLEIRRDVEAVFGLLIMSGKLHDGMVICEASNNRLSDLMKGILHVDVAISKDGQRYYYIKCILNGVP